MCRVDRGFRARVHSHPVDETYIFLSGAGLLRVDDRVGVVTAPCRIRVPSARDMIRLKLLGGEWQARNGTGAWATIHVLEERPKGSWNEAPPGPRTRG